MITNENIIAATSSQTAAIPELGQSVLIDWLIDWLIDLLSRDDDIFCAFLPLAHILEVDCELACLMNGVQVDWLLLID